MGQFPELSYNPSHISRVESEQAATIVLGHVLDERLDAVFGDFSNANIFQIEDGSPWLDGSWDHGVFDDILQEEVRDSDKSVNIDSWVDHSADIDDKNWAHVLVASNSIDDTKLELGPVVLKVQVEGLVPRCVLQDFIISLLVVPFEAL